MGKARIKPLIMEGILTQLYEDVSHVSNIPSSINDGDEDATPTLTLKVTPLHHYHQATKATEPIAILFTPGCFEPHMD